MLTFGSLFAGIGGFDLGLERAGMTCAWQVEREPYAVRVLEKHWPNVRRHDDVCTFPPAEGDWSVDLICGGFPCQDISVAGKGLGLAGARSGLWHQMHRIIGEIRPRFVLVENVAALLGRGMATVLGDLSAIGYDAEWHVVPASAVGAPHRRERVWIVAHARCVDGNWRASEQILSDRKKAERNKAVDHSERCCEVVAHANDTGREQQRRPEPAPAEHPAAECGGWWSVEPDVGRVAHGVPSRVDRLRGLGNAVVPQIVELIGRRIIEHAARQEAG